MNIFDMITGFLAPHACVRCNVEGSLICAACGPALPPLPSRCYRCGVTTIAYAVCAACTPHTPLTHVQPVTPYDGPAKQVIHALKFERAQAAAEAIAGAMAFSIAVQTGVIVTHAPTAYGRVRQRGYDQAQLIAQAYARQARLPYSRTLARQGARRQLGQSGVVRRQQMATAFRVVANDAVAKRDVLIIDDVITTGSTLEAAAYALQSAGARSIRAAVFAAV